MDRNKRGQVHLTRLAARAVDGVVAGARQESSDATRSDAELDRRMAASRGSGGSTTPRLRWRVRSERRDEGDHFGYGRVRCVAASVLRLVRLPLGVQSHAPDGANGKSRGPVSGPIVPA